MKKKEIFFLTLPMLLFIATGASLVPAIYKIEPVFKVLLLVTEYENGKIASLQTTLINMFFVSVFFGAYFVTKTVIRIAKVVIK